MDIDVDLARLSACLQLHDSLAIAVSGGVDSLTLATVAGRLDRSTVTMFHAVSAAVPSLATQRVQTLARQEGWQLEVITAGELETEDYVANPVNRCLYCKRALYTSIAAIAANTSAQIVSGANVDDLSDYRPGLSAAAEAGVRHPFIEVGIDKVHVRAIARHLGLGDIAELPASPCLSSRVETGIRLSADILTRIDAAERLVREMTPARDVRCRVRRAGIVVELDQSTLDRLDASQRGRIVEAIRSAFGAGHEAMPSLAPYRMGSAFLRPEHEPVAATGDAPDPASRRVLQPTLRSPVVR